MNPMYLINTLRGGANPQQLAMNILQQQMSSTPIGKNLLTLAQNGDAQQIEQIARNMVSSRGLDYDTEFNTFKQMLGIK